jgi:hypothetical protein
MIKTTLSETFFVYNFLEKISKIDNNLIKNHLQENYSQKNKFTNDIFSDKYNFYNFKHHQHIQWLYEYIKDYYFCHFQKTLIILNQYFLIQQKNESINIRNNIDYFNSEGSADICCLYTLSSKKNNCNLIMEYTDNKYKLKKWKLPLEDNKIILHSSSINSHITKNESDEDFYNIFFEFKEMNS